MSTCNYTCKIPIFESDSVCIMNSEWNQNCVDVLLLYDNQAWNGNFQIEDNDFVLELIDQLGITKDKYKLETKNALTGSFSDNIFIYTLEDNIFTWKKIVKEDMTIKYGYIFLTKCSVFSTFEKIIDYILQSNLKMKEKLENYEQLNESLDEDNKNLQRKLNNLIEDKNTMESTLYGQFLNVLNEKKKKIDELEGNLDLTEGTEGNNDLDPNNKSSTDNFQLPCTTIRNASSSFDGEETNLCDLPKRSKKNRNIQKQKTDSGILSIKEVINKEQINIPEHSCVMGKSTSTGNSEDVFMFPTSTHLLEDAKEIKLESSPTTDKESSNLKNASSLSCERSTVKNVNRTKKSNLEEPCDNDCKGFSSSTLDMLNQLM